MTSLLSMLAATLVLSPLGSFASDLASLSPGANEVHVMHDELPRRLVVTTPKTFDRLKAYPILFCFHGAGGKAEGQSNRWSPQADKQGIIVVSAEAVQPMAKWNFVDGFHAEHYDDVGFVSKVVEMLIAQKIADQKRIYATGHSSGGLFCWRLAKESSLFAALSPMSCGMVKNGHEPDHKTIPVPVMQVIGDKDKSFNGSTNPKVTMYSGDERIEIWRTFNQCVPDPAIEKVGDEITVYTYVNSNGVEVVYCKVKDQEHHIRRDLRDNADSLAIDFLLSHKGMQE